MNLECAIIDCDQRTEAWFEARRGVVTASRLKKTMLGSGKTAAAARDALICEVLADALTPDQLGTADAPDFENYWMRRGTALESVARAEYSRISGHPVREVGFCVHYSGGFGCSPDGLVTGPDGVPLGGVEIKCPMPEKHIAYVQAGGLPEQYECQVHASMAVTDLPWWDFVSYCPGLPMLIHAVHRNEFTETLKQFLLDLQVDIAAARAKLADLWNKQFTCNQ